MKITDRWVWSGLELNSAADWTSRVRFEEPWSKLYNRLRWSNIRQYYTYPNMNYKLQYFTNQYFYLVNQKSKSSLQLCKHAIKSYQQHLTGTHLGCFLHRAVHAAWLDQFWVLGSQNPENEDTMFSPSKNYNITYCLVNIYIVHVTWWYPDSGHLDRPPGPWRCYEGEPAEPPPVPAVKPHLRTDR